MKLDDIKLMNDIMIKYLKSMGKSTERNEIIKYILEDDDCFQKLSKEDACIILKDVGISNEKIKCKILDKIQSKESNLIIDIYQGLPKADKMELIIQKCSELGVSRIVPVNMKRCVVNLQGKDEKKKM